MTDKYYIEYLIQKELQEANGKFPQFASMHEGWAVICEEMEETQGELFILKELLFKMWKDVKCDNKKSAIKTAEQAKSIAVSLIAEAIQVGAMCDKFCMLGKGRQNNE